MSKNSNDIITTNDANPVKLTVLQRMSNAAEVFTRAENDSVMNHNGVAFLDCIMSDDITQGELNDWSLSDDGQRCIEFCVQRLLHGASDWSLQVTKVMMRWESFSTLISRASHEERFMMLEVLQHVVRLPTDATPVPSQEAVDAPVHCDVIKFVCEDFKSLSASTILDTPPEKPTLPFLVMANELEILCQLSTNEMFFPLLHNNTDLLRSALALLHHTHRLSKLPGNMFTSKHKLSDVQRSCANDDGTTSGSKRDLIRLIGNLCHKNRVNQDLVRELDGVPLILDTTQIDATNPFITQWSLLAIRNLCEDNPGNQSLVASLRRHGLANQVDELRELGVEAKLVGDKIVVRDIHHPDTM